MRASVGSSTASSTTSGTRTAPAFRTAFLPGRAARQYPLTNLYEDKDAVYLEALAPGVDPATLELSVVGNTLCISGEKRRVAGEVHRRPSIAVNAPPGRSSGRSTCPVDVDEQHVQANYTDGLLLVTLPKAEKAKPKQIAVQVS